MYFLDKENEGVNSKVKNSPKDEPMASQTKTQPSQRIIYEGNGSF